MGGRHETGRGEGRSEPPGEIGGRGASDGPVDSRERVSDRGKQAPAQGGLGNFREGISGNQEEGHFLDPVQLLLVSSLVAKERFCRYGFLFFSSSNGILTQDAFIWMFPVCPPN